MAKLVLLGSSAMRYRSEVYREEWMLAGIGAL